MRQKQMTIVAGFALVLASAGLADTITLKSGRVINGTYLGGSPRQIKVEVGDQIETLDVGTVARIEFGGGPAAIQDDDRRPTMRRNDSGDGDRPVLRRANNADSSDDDRPTLRRADNSGGGAPSSGSPSSGAPSGGILRPDPADTGAPAPAASAGTIELAAGTNMVVRMIDGVDSDSARTGQTYNASLDEPVVDSHGNQLIPRGADVIVKLVDAKDSGKLTGRAELTLSLMQVKVNGQMVDINTQTISRESGSRGEKTAKVAGGAAVAGAVLGGILGGGKGALGGAAAGGAAGAGVQAVTKGERVRIPSETRLTFVLDSPVRI